jgi:hypothetical protein
MATEHSRIIQILKQIGDSLGFEVLVQKQLKDTPFIPDIQFKDGEKLQIFEVVDTSLPSEKERTYCFENEIPLTIIPIGKREKDIEIAKKIELKYAGKIHNFNEDEARLNNVLWLKERIRCINSLLKTISETPDETADEAIMMVSKDLGLTENQATILLLSASEEIHNLDKLGDYYYRMISNMRETINKQGVENGTTVL